MSKYLKIGLFIDIILSFIIIGCIWQAFTIGPWYQKLLMLCLAGFFILTDYHSAKYFHNKHLKIT